MKSIIEKIVDKIEECKVEFIDISIKEKLPNFSVEKMKEIIIDYKNKEKSIKKEKIIAITNGNPYTTIILLMESIISESKIIIYNQGNLNELNQKIIDIIAGEIDIKIEPELESKLKINDIEQYLKENKKTKILVIDDIEKYEILKVMGLPVENKQILSIHIYTDSDEYKTIKQAMIDYCKNNYIKIISSNLKNQEEIENDIKKDISKITIILTKEEERYKKLQEKLKTEDIYINMNPFDTIEQEIAKQIIMNVNKI